jgi:acetylornithine/N-succinyldiaminopimelate aminotransferase
MGAIMVTPEVAPSLRPGTHASTFGGSSIVCAAAIAVFSELLEGGLLRKVGEAAAHFAERLKRMREKGLGVREVRQCGLMIGIELDVPGKGVASRCMEKGLLLNCTHNTILRMLPAYTITPDEIDQGMEILEESLGNVPTKTA